MTENEERVARHYNEVIFEAELNRTVEQFPVELAMTCRHLERHVTPGSVVAEVGVGGGLYSEFLAERGCRLYLIDISGRLLEAVAARLRAAGFGECILGVHQVSATRLEPLAAGSCDAVLLLGPLYHLVELEDRQRAVGEAARVLREGGVLLAGGINRLAYLRDLFREFPDRVRSRREFHERHLWDGIVDEEHAPPIGLAHMTAVGEFRQLFAAGFEEIALVAVESFTSPWQSKFRELRPEDREAWLELVEQTGTWPEAFGLADHYLYVGRRL